MPTDREHTRVATRRSFTTDREKLVFEDGSAEKTFVVTLTKAGEESAATAPPASTPGPATPSQPSTAAPRPAASTAGATLNINSIPRSNVLLDGRPIGQTPKIGVSVSAGPHTVVFIKDGERKTASVTVPAGGNKTVAVRF